MIMNQWVPNDATGSFYKLIQWHGSPMLESVEMLSDGHMAGEHEACDVSTTAFDDDELAQFAAKVAPALDATPQQIIDAIRG